MQPYVEAKETDEELKERYKIQEKCRICISFSV